MTPERKTYVDGHLVEEFYWNGKMVVYVDHRATELSYDDIVYTLKTERLTGGRDV